MPDPREELALPARDLEGLAFIGRGWEVAQYQLRAAIFPGRSEVVTSRRVRTWAKRKLIHVVTWMGMGNLLRLTASGRELVVAAGLAKEADLFTPQRSVAMKDIRHLLYVNDIRTLALQGIPIRAETIAPAWDLQRRFQPPLEAIPDLLLVTRTNGASGRVLAMEIDLGTERLTATFLPKLRILIDVLHRLAHGRRIGVIVLTRGPKRLEALRAGLAEIDAPVPILAKELPKTTGLEGLTCLAGLLTRPVQASEHPEGG